MEADWAELSGKGVIHSWTVTHHPFSVAMREQLPLILIAVELDEGVRMHAPLRGQEPDVLRIGLPVQLIFESSGTETVYPAFVLAE